jgi:hypothetical protein
VNNEVFFIPVGDGGYAEYAIRLSPDASFVF